MATLPSFFTAREENEITVGIPDDEAASAPRLAPKWLRNVDSCCLILEKQWLRIIERDRCGEQLIDISPPWVDDWGVDRSQIQPSAVTIDLRVEGGLAINKRH